MKVLLTPEYLYQLMADIHLLKTFSADFFAHPIAQVFHSLKTQGLRIRIESHQSRNLLFFISLFFKIQWNSC